MTGKSFPSLILEKIHRPQAGDLRYLWIADENFDLSPAQLEIVRPSATVLTNRFDIAEFTLAHGIPTAFSDFDTSQLTEQFDTVIYRVSKERYVTHYCLNTIPTLLNVQGHLLLGGRKQEGIKTYHDKAVKLLGFQGHLSKEGDWYLADLSTGNISKDFLNDGNYRQLRLITECFGYRLFSKPGVFGWKTVDAGSELLATCLQGELDRAAPADKSVLDLGCGSGYLTLLAASAGFRKITATDNNAAAIDVVRYNCNTNGIQADIRPDDCGKGIDGRFDYILCNPPFHQGFDTNSALTEKFIQATRRLLLTDGCAYFVVNAFIPIEAVADAHFKKITVLHNNKKFKVVKLQK